MILRNPTGFTLHQVELGQDSYTWRAPVLAPFAIDAKVSALLARGGHLGDEPVPSTPLVGIVDDFESLHLATTGPFGTWGLVDGMPLG